MEESTSPSLHSGFIGFKKLKNVLASRFTDQQNIAHPSFDTNKIELDVSFPTEPTVSGSSSILAPFTSGSVTNQNLIITDTTHCDSFNEFNTQNEGTSDQSSIFHFNVVTSQPTNEDLNNHNPGEASTSESQVVYQLPAVDNRIKILSELSKIQQSIQILFETQTQLSEAQKQLQIIQDEVRNELESIKNQNRIYESRDLLEENGIDLPIKTMEIFNKYCTLLEESSECRQILETAIHYTVNRKKSLTKNISTILRKYLSTKLGSQFTAVKVAKKKSILAKTSFYKHMLNCFLERSASGTIGKLTEREFNRALGEVLWNAKDWNKKKPS